jgi:hypothetical protein
MAALDYNACKSQPSLSSTVVFFFNRDVGTLAGPASSTNKRMRRCIRSPPAFYMNMWDRRVTGSHQQLDWNTHTAQGSQNNFKNMPIPHSSVQLSAPIFSTKGQVVLTDVTLTLLDPNLERPSNSTSPYYKL